MADAKSVYTQFKKKELLEICSELGVEAAPDVNTRKLADLLIEDIQTNGLPDDYDEISDSLFEFLVVGEWIDEEGNILEKEDDAEEGEETVEEDVPDWVCFSFADSRDPACNKCSLFTRCEQARIAKRPECFGRLYNKNEPECQVCIEAPNCMIITTDSIKEMKNG